MKKLFSLALMLLMVTIAFAQSDIKDDEKFFLGKWSLIIEGLPTGDTEMILEVVKNEDGTMGGKIGDAGGVAVMQLKSATIEEGDLKVVFAAQGFDVPIVLERQEDGTVTGSMNDMFDVTGKRYVKPAE